VAHFLRHRYDHLKETGGRPFVSTSNSLHKLKSEHLGTVPAPSYLLPYPNKIPSYSLFDVGLKPKEQKLPINAAHDLHLDGDIRSWGRAKAIAGKTQFVNCVENNAEEAETAWPSMLPTINARNFYVKFKV
jgi:hypothetical protein